MSDGQHRLVTDVRIVRRGSRARTVYLDGEPWRRLPAELVAALGIEPGNALDPEAVGSAYGEAAPRLARERAYRLLGYRERSSAEVSGRLRDDGYDDATVATVVTDLVRSGIIDDERFAAIIVRQQIEFRAVGRARARHELVRRGIQPDSADALLDEVAPPEEEPGRAAAEARRLLRRGDTAARLASRLVRRGFSPADSLRAARDIIDPDDTPGVPEDGL